VFLEQLKTFVPANVEFIHKEWGKEENPLKRSCGLQKNIAKYSRI